MRNPLIIVRGGGDLATGTIHRLHQAGFQLLVLETTYPAAIRRTVAFSEAVYANEATVEGVTAKKVEALQDWRSVSEKGEIPVFVDPLGEAIKMLSPDVVIDAIIAKKNLGTRKDMAPLTIALGPGFEAGVDVDVVIETKRGHNLGRILTSGCAIPNTGIPGVIGGYGKERVLHAQASGILYNLANIGDQVKQGEEIAEIIDDRGVAYPVRATIDGLLRGLIRDGYPVSVGFKIADIDPRLSEYENCFTISDKARCIAGSVLEVVCGSLMRDGTYARHF